jgi:hypothetical protein
MNLHATRRVDSDSHLVVPNLPLSDFHPEQFLARDRVVNYREQVFPWIPSNH